MPNRILHDLNINCKIMETRTNNSELSCLLCHNSGSDDMKMGLLHKLKSKKKGSVVVTATAYHHYCLLFSSGLSQDGEDDEGILGFLETSIKKEVSRGKRLHCSYCNKRGATVGCSRKRCRHTYHMPCGMQHGAQFSFKGEFNSWCPSHRHHQSGPGREEKGDCPICMEEIIPDTSNALWAPCCSKDSWFHRYCVQRLAVSAGYFFKCPLCNNKDKFIAAMQEFGIYVPEKDASWELEPNAYQDLLQRPVNCEAPICLCPSGRNFDKDDSPWELAFCQLCGSQGIHGRCKILVGCRKDGDWHCPECTTLLAERATREKAEIRAQLQLKNANDAPREKEDSLKKDDADEGNKEVETDPKDSEGIQEDEGGDRAIGNQKDSDVKPEKQTGHSKQDGGESKLQENDEDKRNNDLVERENIKDKRDCVRDITEQADENTTLSQAPKLEINENDKEQREQVNLNNVEKNIQDNETSAGEDHLKDKSRQQNNREKQSEYKDASSEDGEIIIYIDLSRAQDSCSKKEKQCGLNTSQVIAIDYDSDFETRPVKCVSPTKKKRSKARWTPGKRRRKRAPSHCSTPVQKDGRAATNSPLTRASDVRGKMSETVGGVGQEQGCSATEPPCKGSSSMPTVHYNDAQHNPGNDDHDFASTPLNKFEAKTPKKSRATYKFSFGSSIKKSKANADFSGFGEDITILISDEDDNNNDNNSSISEKIDRSTRQKLKRKKKRSKTARKKQQFVKTLINTIPEDHKMSTVLESEDKVLVVNNDSMCDKQIKDCSKNSAVNTSTTTAKENELQSSSCPDSLLNSIKRTPLKRKIGKGDSYLKNSASKLSKVQQADDVSLSRKHTDDANCTNSSKECETNDLSASIIDVAEKEKLRLNLSVAGLDSRSPIKKTFREESKENRASAMNVSNYAPGHGEKRIKNTLSPKTKRRNYQRRKDVYKTKQVCITSYFAAK
uniref:G2/M phase-specific E3 ubiquitin-protein ligase n=1 Tax=Hirondellea gigas TaxID=1518452 RepID=A0A6A7FRD7_9CRUS